MNCNLPPPTAIEGSSSVHYIMTCTEDRQLWRGRHFVYIPGTRTTGEKVGKKAVATESTVSFLPPHMSIRSLRAEGPIAIGKMQPGFLRTWTMVHRYVPRYPREPGATDRWVPSYIPSGRVTGREHRQV